MQNSFPSGNGDMGITWETFKGKLDTFFFLKTKEGSDKMLSTLSRRCLSCFETNKVHLGRMFPGLIALSLIFLEWS